MKFGSPLIEGTLLKRYKRFLADVELPSGEKVTVHVPNSGSMMGVNTPGSKCRISLSTTPGRKLPYTLEMVRASNGAWVGVNTSWPNKLIWEAFHSGLISEWKSYEHIQKEVKISDKTRLDFVLSKGAKKCYVEVKNVSMSLSPYAVFPDAVTERGQKHLHELMNLAKQGHGAEIFFVVQRTDCRSFRPCHEIDETYSKLLKSAFKARVKIRVWSCKLNSREIALQTELPVEL